MIRFGKLALLSLFALATSAFAAEGFTYNFHGFVGTSAYYQTSPDMLLNGQGPLVLLNSNSSPTFGFDVRQSRMNLSVSGPQVLGATPTAVIEADFFGLNTPGNYGEVSATPRLRLAYAELKWENWTIHAGQDWELLWVQAPKSEAHVAFPVNWFSGLVAWRDPGVGVFYKMGVSSSSNLEFAGQLLKSDWQNPLALGASTKADLNVDAGQLSARPGVEARVKWSMDTTANAYVAAHWNRVAASQAKNLDYTGTDTFPAATSTRDFDVQLGKVGGKYTFGPVFAMAELYTGKNLGPLFGNFNQFPVANDVSETGGWVQVGWALTDTMLVTGDYGTSQAKSSDAVAAAQAIHANTTYNFMFQYKVGNLALAPEINFIRTTLASGVQASAQQYSVSANYYF